MVVVVVVGMVEGGQPGLGGPESDRCLVCGLQGWPGEPARAPGSEEPRLVLDDVVHDGVLQHPHDVVLQVVQLGG